MRLPIKLIINVCICQSPAHAEIIIQGSDNDRIHCGFFGSKEALHCTVGMIKQYHNVTDDEIINIRATIDNLEHLFETEAELIARMGKPPGQGQFIKFSHRKKSSAKKKILN